MYDLFFKAKKFTPGGVHSPVRSCSQVGLDPLFWHSAEKAWLVDTNNKKYLDYICGFGPIILGHAHPIIKEALVNQAGLGTIFGGCNEQSAELCAIICEALDSVESVRLMNTGTEACSTAIRIARAATGKNKIIKCLGAYHGHGDAFLVSAGSGSLTLGQPSSPGVPKEAIADTLLVPFNDIMAIEKQIELYTDIGAVIVEPICGNMGMILPQKDYLMQLQRLCNKHGIILIFDEVMTGFRVGFTGAQGFYNIKPDLTVLGKVIGGGMPIGAVAGSSDLMNLLSPVGTVYQGGTFSANPMSVAAGVACLSYLRDKSYCYDSLNKYTSDLTKGAHLIAQKYDIALQSVQLGAMMGLFFADVKINNLADTANIKQDLFTKFYAKMREGGIIIPPSAYEAWFITLQHTKTELDHTLDILQKVFLSLAENNN